MLNDSLFGPCVRYTDETEIRYSSRATKGRGMEVSGNRESRNIVSSVENTGSGSRTEAVSVN